MKLRLGFVYAEDRALVELLVCVVLRVRIALGGIDEDAILVSHRKRVGLPPEREGGNDSLFSLSAPARSVMASHARAAYPGSEMPNRKEIPGSPGASAGTAIGEDKEVRDAHRSGHAASCPTDRDPDHRVF